jgi:hypothetical protein
MYWIKTSQMKVSINGEIPAQGTIGFHSVDEKLCKAYSKRRLEIFTQLTTSDTAKKPQELPAAAFELVRRPSMLEYDFAENYVLTKQFDIR